MDLGLPYGIIVAAIQRDGRVIVPRGDVALFAGDVLVLGAESFQDDKHIDLKEIVLRGQNPWIGQKISELDISRRTIIVMVRRNGGVRIPRGDLILEENDTVILYTQMHLRDAERIRI